MFWKVTIMVLLANSVVILSIVLAWEAFTDLQRLRDPALTPSEYWLTFSLYAAVQMVLWAVVIMLYSLAWRV